MLGKTYAKTGDDQKAETCIQDAISIFSLEAKKEYLEKAKQDLNTIRLKLTT